MSKKRMIGDILDSISITHAFKDDRVIFLNTSDVLEGEILTNSYMPISKLKGQAKKTIENGDILFSEIRPKNKRYAYVNVPNPEDYVVSTKLMVLRNKTTDVRTDYVYYYLTYEDTLNYLQKRAENRICSFPQITFDILKPMQIRVPSCTEQKSIASILSSIDAKIKVNNRINAQLEAMAKMLYDYWFVQFDFPDNNGNPYKSSGGKMSYNKKLKRKIPDGWKDGALSDIADITMGQSPAGSSYNETGEGEIFFQGSTDFGLRSPTIRQYTTQPKRMAKAGDILLSVRAPVGTLNIADVDCCIGRGLAALRSKQGCDCYLYNVMLYFKQIFDRRNAEGTTFGAIGKDDLHSLKTALPANEKLIAKFNTAVSDGWKQLFNLHKQNQQLAELRDWLLPMLMNGQVTVKPKTADRRRTSHG